MRKVFWAAALFSTAAFAAEEARVIYLWPHGAPGSEGITKKELIEDTGPGEHRVSSIHNPSLTVFLPSRDKATGAAVIVIPGGGHRFLSIDSEGYNVGKFLSAAGIAGFVLKHRLAREDGSIYKVEVHSLQDTQRAIRLVRNRAKEWGVDPARVGVVGFSAGGELAYLASTHFDAGIDGAPDPVDREKSRPDFQALIYPGLPRELNVTKEMPPTFLVCASDDRPNISEALPGLYLSLKKAGVPVELHIYTSGGHGFGLRDRPLPVFGWAARLREWMGDRGYLKK
jgi:endo-1,4-beta-xylanase